MTTSDTIFTIRGYQFPARSGYVLLAMLGIAGAVVLYAFDPREPGLYPICPFFGLTGFHCPGCGAARALHQLLHGNITAALGYNPLTILALPFIAYSFGAGALRAFRLWDLPRVFVPHQWIWALLAVITAFWLLRNVPIEPLTALAP